MEKNKNQIERDIESLDDEATTNSLQSWIIAIIVTAVAIYAVPTLIGMVM